MAKLVVVGGGSGFIGKAVCSSLEKAGYKAVVVTRRPEGMPNALSWNEIENTGLPPNTHAVINLAGEPAFNIMRRWNDNLISDLYKSRIGTTSIMKQAILNSSTPPQFWGSISAVGFYKPDVKKVYNEESNIEENDFWTKMVVEWENASKLPNSSPVRHCIIRSGVVLGNDGGSFQKMLLPFKLGLGGPIGSGKQWFPWIHIDDMAGIFMHALTNDNVNGILNGVSPEICTNQEFTRQFGTALHRPAFIPVPGFLLQAFFGETRASMVLEGQNVYPKRTLESGYQYLYPSLPAALNNLVS